MAIFKNLPMCLELLNFSLVQKYTSGQIYFAQYNVLYTVAISTPKNDYIHFKSTVIKVRIGIIYIFNTDKILSSRKQ